MLKAVPRASPEAAMYGRGGVLTLRIGRLTNRCS